MKSLLCTLITFAALKTSLAACDFSKAKNVKEKRLSSGTVELGTLQVSAKDQNPIVKYSEGGRQLFCRNDYDTTAADARSVAVTADKDHLFLAFSIDGGGAGNSFTRFTQNGWQKSYGSGGGSKVLVILKVRKTDGEPVAGTYLTARKNDGKTNSVILKNIQFTAGKLEVTAQSWSSPLKHDLSPYACSGKSPYRYTVRLSGDLGTAVATDAENCK